MTDDSDNFPDYGVAVFARVTKMARLVFPTKLVFQQRTQLDCSSKQRCQRRNRCRTETMALCLLLLGKNRRQTRRQSNFLTLKVLLWISVFYHLRQQLIFFCLVVLFARRLSLVMVGNSHTSQPRYLLGCVPPPVVPTAPPKNTLLGLGLCRDESMAAAGAAAVRELLLSFSSAALLLLLLFLAQQPLVSSLNVITHLPGFEGPLPFHLETG
ncbi:hypothetical protein BHM03_00005821 [Ensete ventricosum]|uniref:Uncharacterized protein n=1 Tax=Ensete ventricosum TaxID=4639 RepID=A0A426Y5P6_ENSVE|nr:hypothetical protein B296_00043040 [Ensete ventricosum]RZR79943.1 hypothetical protein BHM03_00005821 [Ensete ventricosum]